VKATLEVINRMQADGVIGKYAIGEAVGATFYLEPAATLDVDVFVSLPKTRSGALLTLTPIYDYLQKRGYKSEGEYVVIEGWPVQFLPPSDALGEEALAQAAKTEVEGVRTWVMTPSIWSPSHCRRDAPRISAGFCSSLKAASSTPASST
jgi:hypothetical protein